jgi:phenylalanine-4-hydroxylase
VARTYRHGVPIPRIQYTADEVATWGAVFERQEQLLQRFACKEYLDILPLMKRHCGYARDNIPQVRWLVMA